MMQAVLEKLKRILTSRLLPITCLFIVLYSLLIIQVYKIQHMESETKQEQEVYKSLKSRDIKATRGDIYDRNGNLLAYNTLSHSLYMEDSALLTTNAQKNSMAHRLVQILEKYGFEPELEFGLALNEKNELYFTLTDNALLRFKKNAYGRTSISALTEAEYNATPQEVFDFMRHGSSNAIRMFDIADTYTLEETLKIMAFRYTLFSTPSGTQFLVATDIPIELISAIKESAAELPGLEIVQKTARVYNDSLYFAHITGYTGAINSTEIETLNAALAETHALTEEDLAAIEQTALLYNSTDVVGKTGIEKSMEPYLSGSKGLQLLTTNASGKIIETEIVTEPTAGNDIYLTIDRECQIAGYHILERYLAAILLDKIVNSMDYGTKGEKASGIQIPVYEAYYSLISNQIIDVSHFEAEDATNLERAVFAKYVTKRESILSDLRLLLAVDSTVANADADEEIQEYLSYAYTTLANNGMLLTAEIPSDDSMYRAYRSNEISMSAFLQYAITKNWVNSSLQGDTNAYFTTEELYEKLLTYLFTTIQKEHAFQNMIYHNLIFTYRLTGKEICLLLFDQAVLESNATEYARLENGSLSAYNFLMQKIENLEITPGMLALEPCSGSIIITDVTNGDVIAMVTYPSYDNNMLANKINWEYYSTLLNNGSYPLVNRPTTGITTTGSTFKPLASLIGLGEGVISTYTQITDLGVFEAIDPSPRCWRYPRSHGSINVTEALMHSCNYFFYEVGYRISLDASDKYSDSLGISKIQQYASLFGLDARSGVEIAETAPIISTSDAVRTAIGYGHSFTPIQIARYVTTIANRGSCYNLTLLDKVYNKQNELVLDNEAELYRQIEQFNETQWNAVHRGMYQVVNTNTNSLDQLYGNLGVAVAGKTGTAQISLTHANNALFVAFAPYEAPKIAVTVVLPNGYQSANAAYVAREMLGFYYNGENREQLLSGDLKAGTATSIVISD